MFPLFLNRVQYLIRSAIISVLPIPFVLLSPYAFLAVYLLTAIYWVAYVALPRASDVGLAKGWSLGLCLIPGVNYVFGLFLLFAKSDSFALR